MGEYEPEDSRSVTLSDHQAPGEPPRTGPREDDARRQSEQAQRTEQSERAGLEAERRSGSESQMEQTMNTARLESGGPLGTAGEDERGETAADPARLRDDADRPLGGS